MLNENLPAYEASVKAMQQIGSAIVATTFVLLAIFVPVGLMAGITGKIYQQFAVAIGTSVVFSAFNALTLSPALCSIFLKNEKENRGRGFFKLFNDGLDKFKNVYIKVVGFFPVICCLRFLLLRPLSPLSDYTLNLRQHLFCRKKIRALFLQTCSWIRLPALTRRMRFWLI